MIDPNLLWIPLMIASVSAACLTLTGGAFLNESLNKYINSIIIEFIDENILKSEDFQRPLHLYILLTVLMFLSSGVCIIFYITADSHAGVYLSYFWFYGATILLGYLILIYLYDFWRVSKKGNPDWINYIAKSEPGVTDVGMPIASSPIVLIHNSAFELQEIEQDLGANHIDAYLIALDTNGIKLNDSFQLGQLTPQKIKEDLNKYLKEKNINKGPFLVAVGIESPLRDQLEENLGNNIKIIVAPYQEIGKWMKEKWPPKINLS
ncbi:MAG: hypothetical protein NTV25_08625 [Methanothrix sp.]|nr:hypothetical protein [Methanothrix sp.]